MNTLWYVVSPVVRISRLEVLYRIPTQIICTMGAYKKVQKFWEHTKLDINKT
jgi:hypothetical protein